MKNKSYILCIEGVAGSGKTTLASKIDKLCNDSNLDSFWVLEESKDHPVTPASLRKKSKKPEFGDLCISSWYDFTQNLNQIAILEGCAFQSTIRFMFANDATFDSILHYVSLWEQAIASVTTKLVLLVTLDSIDSHVEHTCIFRGKDWTEKVSNYVANTPFGKERNLHGMQGMKVFWSVYQDLCMNIVNQTKIPHMITDISGMHWEGLEYKVYDWAFSGNA